MVEEKASDFQGEAVEGGHGHFPLCEVINSDDDIIMPFDGCQFSFHEINGPFVKGVCFMDMVEGGRWCSHFRGKYLTVCIALDSQDAITKECRPEITGAHNYLGGGHARCVATTCATVRFI